MRQDESHVSSRVRWRANRDSYTDSVLHRVRAQRAFSGYVRQLASVAHVAAPNRVGHQFGSAAGATSGPICPETSPIYFVRVFQFVTALPSAQVRTLAARLACAWRAV